MDKKSLLINLIIELLLPIAEEVVESTDNPYDDKLIEGLKFIAGKKDINF